MNDMADTLVSRMCSLLSDKPLFIILNSYTSGLSPSACGCLLTLHARERFGKNAVCDELGLPSQKRVYACRAAARQGYLPIIFERCGRLPLYHVIHLFEGRPLLLFTGTAARR